MPNTNNSKGFNGTDRLKLIKTIKKEDIFIAFPFPTKFYHIPQDLLILNQICEIAGLNTTQLDNGFKILLYTKTDNKWHQTYSDINFQTYITEIELKEWIFELFNLNHTERNNGEDDEQLSAFFFSQDHTNILLALNILIYRQQISDDIFSLVLATHNAFVPRLKIAGSDQIQKLSEEIILKYIPPSIWSRVQQTGIGQRINGKVDKFSMLQFFKNFSINENQIQQCLISKGQTYPAFMIDLNKNEMLPENIKKLKAFHDIEVRLNFIGKGNIVPVINKVANNLNKLKGFGLYSLEKGGLDLSLSDGVIQNYGTGTIFNNFYCSGRANIKFLGLEIIIWRRCKNMMLNIGYCFPILNDLRIHEANFNRFEISTAKKSLTQLSIYTYKNPIWEDSFNQQIWQLNRLETLRITGYNIKTHPDEFSKRLPKLKKITLR